MLKKLFHFFLVIQLSAFSQTNLVPNPSFENYTICPSTNANITDCANWMNFGNSPEYFNGCAGTTGMGIPSCGGFGFQYPHSGIAHAGLVSWLNPAGSSGPNYREFIGVQLTSNLQIGIKYFLSFYINWSAYPHNSPQSKVASNKIGLRFSTVASSSVMIAPINDFAHLYSNVIYTDTVNWLRVSGSFIADSAYNYIILGNFFSDVNTDTSSISGGLLIGNIGAYYFVDDVCVSTDSTYNANWTSINSHDKQQDYLFKFFPNPASNILFIESMEEIEDLFLHDLLGNLIYELYAIKNKKIKFELESIPKGIYTIRIRTRNYTKHQKLYIN